MYKTSCCESDRWTTWHPYSVSASSSCGIETTECAQHYGSVAGARTTSSGYTACTDKFTSKYVWYAASSHPSRSRTGYKSALSQWPARIPAADGLFGVSISWFTLPDADSLLCSLKNVHNRYRRHLMLMPLMTSSYSSNLHTDPNYISLFAFRVLIRSLALSPAPPRASQIDFGACCTWS